MIFKKKLLSSIVKNCCYIPFLFLIFKWIPIITYRKKSDVCSYAFSHLKMKAHITWLQWIHSITGMLRKWHIYIKSAVSHKWVMQHWYETLWSFQTVGTSWSRLPKYESLKASGSGPGICSSGELYFSHNKADP